MRIWHDNGISCDPTIIFNRDATSSFRCTRGFAIPSYCCQHCVLAYNATVADSDLFSGMNNCTITEDNQITCLEIPWLINANSASCPDSLATLHPKQFE
jgi:hypothetical protein